MSRLKHFSKKTFKSLKIYNFRLYFFSQAISLSGTWMQVIGQSWLVLKITGSGTALGVVTALQFLPVLVFGAWGGVLADRFNKRKLLYFTQSISALLALILWILVLTGNAHLWAIELLALALGFVNAVDSPTRQVFISEMVGTDYLNNAVSVNSLQVNLARVVGPAIAGIIIATLGIGACFFVNAISFIPVVIALVMMREHELHVADRIKTVRGQVREGLRYVRATPALRDTLIMMAIIGTLAYEFTVVVPLFAQFTLHGDAGTYALLNTAIGIGSMIGGFYTAQFKKITQKMIYTAAFLFGLSMFVVASMPTLTTAFFAMIVTGFFSISFLSRSNSLLQIESSPEMRGRVMALWAVAFLGSTPIGGPIIGWVSQVLGPRYGLVVGGVACLCASLYGYVSLRARANQSTTPLTH
ncbi:MAG: MFS transporter [bacterium]